MYLTIIIPLYNESSLVTTTLDRLLSVPMPSFVTAREIIVIDDCSSDNSYETVMHYVSAHHDIRVIRHERNMGKGAAVRTGVQAAAGDTVLIQDADLELNPSDIPGLLTMMYDNNLDIASGSRFINRRRQPAHCRPALLANRLFSVLASGVSGRHITDLTCGYKVLHRQLFITSQLKEDRFGFETELMMKTLSRKPIAFGEHPVTYSPRKKAEGKKIRLIDGLSILWKIIRYGIPSKRWLSALSVAVTVIIVMSTILSARRWQNEKLVIEWDVISYYSYLPAAFIYHDMDLSFIENYNGPHKFVFWPDKGPDGQPVIKTTMGLSLLYMPFFLGGHAAALITGADAGGFSPPYKVALLISAVFYLLLGLLYLRKLLLEYCSDFVTAIVVASIVFGTNLFFYSTYQATMSHVYSFALIIMFLWHTVKWHRSPSSRHSVVIGLLAGLIALIRPTNAIIILAFIFYNVISLSALREKIRFFSGNYRMILLIIITAVIVWIPQMIYWRDITGHFLFYSYTSGEGFFFSHPQIMNGLFSYRKGLLLYTPLLFFSFAGAYYLWKSSSPFALSFTLFLPLNIYIIYSWWCWWYGGSFGSRPFIDCYGFMALSAGVLLQWFVRSGRTMIKAIPVVLFLLTASLGLYYHKQYYYGAIHWDSMTREAFFDSLGRLKPSPAFQSLLAEPDYEKAKMGIQATKPAAVTGE